MDGATGMVARWLLALMPSVECDTVDVLELNSVLAEDGKLRFGQYIGYDQGYQGFGVAQWVFSSKVTLIEHAEKEKPEVAIIWKTDCGQLRIVGALCLVVTRHVGDVEVFQRGELPEERRRGWAWEKRIPEE